MDEKKTTKLLKVWDALEAVISTEEDFHFFFDRLLELKMFNVIRRWHEMEAEKERPFDKPPGSEDGH